jgi:histidyl-tRNA synthetase
MGDVVMGLVLEKFGHLPAEAQRGDAPVLVTLFDEASVLPSLRLATELRRAGLRVACFPQVDRLGVQLRYADRIGVRVAVILGPDELSRGSVTVRDLRASTQHTVERENAARLIRALLDAQSQVA